MSGTGSGPGSDGNLERLIAEFERSGLRELHVRHEGLEIYLSSDPAAAGIGGATVAKPAPAAAAPAAPATALVAAARSAPATVPAGSIVVPAPYLGTFYRAPKPGAAPYVEIGERVAADDEICLVEVMKLFTAVRAGTGGTIAAILATDGDMVEADQPLFAIRPD